MWAYKDFTRFNSNLEKAFKRRYTMKIALLQQFESLKNSLNLQLQEYSIFWDESISRLSRLESNSIDLILTSPPYLHAIDYIEEDITQISYFFDDKAITRLKQDSIGNRFGNMINTERIYWLRMERIISALYRVLKEDKYLILVIGTFYQLKEKYLELLQKHGFKVASIYTREAITIHRTSHNREYILIVKKSVI
jgi:DNA modification methylase